MSERTIQDLFATSRRNQVAKGTVLVDPYMEPNGAFLVYDGFVKAYDIGPDGSYQLFDIITAGHVFPLKWALGYGHVQLFFETMRVSTLGFLPQETFQAAIHADEALLKDALNTVLQSYDSSQQHIRNLQFRSAQERIAYYLVLLGDRYSLRANNDLAVQIPLVYQDIADITNLTRETVNRIMRQFMNCKLLSYARGDLVIHDIDGLKVLYEQKQV